MLESEIQYGIQGGIRLYDGDNKTEFEGGVLTLTSHRLIYIDASRGQALALPLQAVKRWRIWTPPCVTFEELLFQN